MMEIERDSITTFSTGCPIIDETLVVEFVLVK